MTNQAQPAAMDRVWTMGRTTCVIGLCAGLAACAGAGSTARPSGAAEGVPSALEQRAVERWELLIDGKPERAYDYLTPGYRSTVGRQEYARNALMGAIRWRAVNWRDAECASADACKARLQVEYTVRMSGAGDVPSINLQEESWLLIDGKWYFLPNAR